MAALTLNTVAATKKHFFKGWKIKSEIFACKNVYSKFVPLLAHGVTGNTSDFGSEESRFEP